MASGGKMAVGLALGLAAGAAIGTANDDLPVWLALGASIGLAAGLIWPSTRSKGAATTASGDAGGAGVSHGRRDDSPEPAKGDSQSGDSGGGDGGGGGD